ncbi:MAG: cupin domain-containing protein [Candidatus Kapabacteria bacterium]|nr:cupin domain-containing protein [Ignavibacteriota bacterium]MCW5884814.1 cupin domain-containing protein [Candidatus Kapabacteria bacterium]
MHTAEYWIEKLGLRAHPEGGFYKETYRSDEFIVSDSLPDRYNSDRSFSTTIYFMITKDSFSKFHKVNSDEFWFFHSGGSAKIYNLTNSGELIIKHFGIDTDNNEFPQILIPQNTWFAAEVENGDYVLLSCTVAPGFDFEDFTLAERNEFITDFPQHKQLIKKLT